MKAMGGTHMKRVLILIVLLLACSAGFAAEEAEPNLAVCPADESPLEIKGKPAPPPACCDPALEPGANGNPLCFEGHTCCSDGRWNCNNPDGTPSCTAGTVCEDCVSNGDSCSSNADCCSGKCKGSRCR